MTKNDMTLSRAKDDVAKYRWVITTLIAVIVFIAGRESVKPAIKELQQVQAIQGADIKSMQKDIDWVFFLAGQ